MYFIRINGNYFRYRCLRCRRHSCVHISILRFFLSKCPWNKLSCFSTPPNHLATNKIDYLLNVLRIVPFFYSSSFQPWHIFVILDSYSIHENLQEGDFQYLLWKLASWTHFKLEMTWMDHTISNDRRRIEIIYLDSRIYSMLRSIKFDILHIFRTSNRTNPVLILSRIFN